jgi:hypothetical protein
MPVTTAVAKAGAETGGAMPVGSVGIPLTLEVVGDDTKAVEVVCTGAVETDVVCAGASGDCPIGLVAPFSN